MKRAAMIGMLVLLSGAFAYCGWRYYSETYLPNKQITEADTQQRELFVSLKPPPERFTRPAGKSAPTDDNSPEEESSPEITDPLAELKAANPDVAGWLTIDGTNIDYPIVQAADNGYYLQRGFDKKANYGLGCPFLDYRCESGFGGFNSIVYAHHIKGNQAMFGDIARYKDSGFMRKNPSGTLLTADGAHNVRFFAYMTIPSTAFAYETDFADDTAREEYINDIFNNANYTIEITPEDLKENSGLRLLLLSTCTYEYWEARGVLVGVIE